MRACAVAFPCVSEAINFIWRTCARPRPHGQPLISREQHRLLFTKLHLALGLHDASELQLCGEGDANESARGLESWLEARWGRDTAAIGCHAGVSYVQVRGARCCFSAQAHPHLSTTTQSNITHRTDALRSSFARCTSFLIRLHERVRMVTTKANRRRLPPRRHTVSHLRGTSALFVGV